MGREVDVLRVTKAERSEGATERERASVTRVGGKRAMSKPRRKGITRVVETEEDGKGNKIAKKRWGRGAYITVKNARGTSAVYTSSTIDRLQREGGRVALLVLAEAGHRAILSAIETGASWGGETAGWRWFSVTETQTMGLTKRSPTGHRRWSRVLWTGLYIVGPLPPYASSGQALRLIDQGVVAGIQRRPRSRSTTIEIIFRGFVSNQLYTPGPNYAACRASFSADFVRTDNRILYPGHWKR